ncbi:MAG: ABC transporter substrate-binding protein [Planctomycetes bacterium]|nr:ABC transporter substrate-binding protein [Planctomycetota bacterium]
MSSHTQRIVSLCPSVTETVFALGCGDRLVGITDWCVHPHGDVDEIEKVGGTKTPNVARILALKPDLVLVNEEENRLEDAQAIEAAGIPVLNTFPRTVTETYEMNRVIGEALERPDRAATLNADIEAALEAARVSRATAGTAPLKVVYLIWRGPFMTVNRDTYIHDLLEIGGAINLTADWEERYPRMSDEQLADAGAEMVLLCSEPFPFTAQYAAEIRHLCSLPSKHAPIVDGEYFSWYGARTAAGVRYVTKKLRQLERVRDEARRGT